MINDKTSLKILTVAIIALVVFGYATYFLMTEISSVKNVYMAKMEELAGVEKKQEQIYQMTKGLVNTEKNREEIIASLLPSEQVLDFIVKIESTAKAAGLAYEVRISKEITQKSIDEELLALRRSRRRGGEVDESAIEEKLPGVVFSIELSGTYSGIIRFLEGVASLPYYTNIENFNISKDGRLEDEAGRIKSVIQLRVFTKT